MQEVVKELAILYQKPKLGFSSLIPLTRFLSHLLKGKHFQMRTCPVTGLKMHLVIVHLYEE